MNPYSQFVDQFVEAVEKAKSLPLGGFEPLPRPHLAAGAPTVLFFSPHPDDECISGGLALRLLREQGMKVLNVAVTQGSNKPRQVQRYHELQAACDHLGLGLIQTGPVGLERITPKALKEDPSHWTRCVDVVERILREQKPKVVFCPHDRDWNGTHIGTHWLVTDAMRRIPDLECYLVETEFWGAMDDPNLMVEISPKDLADMIAALTFHVGEVTRNPYHLSLPAWMMDNVRRGAELVGGQGGAAPEFKFAVLNRIRKWSGGAARRYFEGGREVGAGADLGAVFA